MCGLMGVIMGSAKRTPGNLGMIRMAYEELMLLGQSRGTHAAGTGVLNASGQLCLFKRKGPAVQFIRSRGYMAIMGALDPATTLIMGHTRWATTGDPSSNANNHPITAGPVFMTHNGVIDNADELFDYYGFNRDGEVDSEILASLAYDSLSNGAIDTLALSGRLSEVEGNMTCVYAVTTNPRAVVLMKGDRPLEAVYVPKLDALFYSSVLNHIEIALNNIGMTERKVAKMQENTIYTADCSGRLKLRKSAKLERYDPTGEMRKMNESRWTGIDFLR